MRKLYLFFVCSVLLVTACSRNENPALTSPDSINVSGILLPEVVECASGSTLEVKVIGKNGPLETDYVELSSAQKAYTMPVALVEKGRFTFTLTDDIYSGEYVFSIVRGDESKRVGKFKLLVTSGIKIESEGATIYGQVSSENAGIPGVVVSDGVEVAVTDKDGIYRLASSKKYGYVFISVPSGYEPMTDGVLPRIYKLLNAGDDIAERMDFTLTPSQGQVNHKMLIMGDIHLANRNQDRAQFAEFIVDVNSYVAAQPGKVYGLTLGDMVWDLYWMTNNYSFPEYLLDINRLNSLTVYQTIGNHDHSMYFTGDFDTVEDYRRHIGPSYYSFNIGNVHYVVLDDVECTNSQPSTDGKGNPCYERDYKGNLVNDVLQWLEKDLAYVSKDKLLIVAMHIPMYDESGVLRMPAGAASKLTALLEEFPSAHLYTAHKHILYNVPVGKIYEHNAGAVCGTWWWSAVESPGIHIGQDGSPGGYNVLDVQGDKLAWQYKPTGAPIDHQFRTYDRNCIHITADKYVASGSSTYQGMFTPGGWAEPNTDNEVYINVWNYDPDWKVEVTEGGSPLEVKQVNEYDPLHLIAYTAKRLNKNAEAGFATVKTAHMFMVKASGPATTLEIKVTDPFGNVYAESMSRPKAFDIESYIK